MRSPKQIQNMIKVIVVAALAKEFRKSEIIKRIIKNAKKNDHIATGGLIRPDVSGAIDPSADDKWLIKPDSVIVRVISTGSQVVGVTVRLNIKHGVEPQYFWLSGKSPDKKWWPNGERIEEWIKLKARRGKVFTITERGVKRNMDPSNISDVNRVSYVISRSIAKKGIKKTDLTDPFYGDKGVLKSVERARKTYTARIYELFLTLVTTEQEIIFSNLTK